MTLRDILVTLFVPVDDIRWDATITGVREYLGKQGDSQFELAIRWHRDGEITHIWLYTRLVSNLGFASSGESSFLVFSLR